MNSEYIATDCKMCDLYDVLVSNICTCASCSVALFLHQLKKETETENNALLAGTKLVKWNVRSGFSVASPIEIT